MSFKNTLLPVANLLQSKGNLLDLTLPVVMGIINTTPDSFYPESRKENLTDILKQAEEMIEQGVRIIDIGGSSTRPGAKDVSEREEMERIIPAITAIGKHFPKIWISVDTYRSAVAKAAVDSGAFMINDISGGLFDPKMMHTVAYLKVPYIAMHTKGSATTMHQNPEYSNVTLEVIDALQKIVSTSEELGIVDLLLDPGFGFAKNIEHNFELLNNMGQLRIFGKPILVGISRKSMIYKTLEISISESLNGTTALHMIALQQGASILRVHDVKPAIETIKLFNSLSK